jgi:hypothetical protein
MTLRDRLMLMGIVTIAVLLGVWFMVVSPERERASKVTAEVVAARTQLATAESEASSARGARANYSTAYASLVSLGQAVPASAETPALIYQLDRATHSRHIQFSSITASGSSSSSSSASATPTPAAQTSGFTAEPFTFVFSGSFMHLYKLLDQLEGFTLQTPSGSLHVNGRLLTIDSLDLAPVANETQGSGSTGSGKKSKEVELTGTVTATAYVLPTSQSALDNATPSGPAGTQTTTSASLTTPAVVKANP